MNSRQKASLTLLLALLTAIGPFAIDTYLPAFHAMAQSLNATQLEVQQTLTMYMVSFSIMALLHGSLSDCFGRKRIIFWATVLFCFASIICALAPSIGWLWAGRILQGLGGGAGAIVSRAVVRDLYDGAEAQITLSRILMIFGIAPAIAPMIGGILLVAGGWRSIFIFIALFSAALCFLVARFLPETLPQPKRQAFNLFNLLHIYKKVLSSPRFVLLAVSSSFAFIGFFEYILSAPVFLMTHLHLGETEFAWLFVPVVIGMTLGAFISAKVAGCWSARQTIVSSFILMAVGGVLNLGYSVFFPPALPFSVIPIMVFSLGVSISLPTVTLLILDEFPLHKGFASSCQSFIQLGMYAIAAGLVVPLLWDSVVKLAVGMNIFFVSSLLCFIGYSVVTKK